MNRTTDQHLLAARRMRGQSEEDWLRLLQLLRVHGGCTYRHVSSKLKDSMQLIPSRRNSKLYATVLSTWQGMIVLSLASVKRYVCLEKDCQ